MIKYLGMENASVELYLHSINDYKSFLENNADSIEKLNIKRILFKIEETDIKEIIEYINKYFKNYSGLIILELYLTKNIDYEIPDNVVIFNTNIKELNILSNYLYYKIDLTNKNIELISKLINHEINVVVNPVIDKKNINDFIDLLNNLFNKVSGKDVNLGGFLIPTDLIKEHPCNAYLCNGFKCMNKVSTLPKVLYIDSNYDIYPHRLIYEYLKIGNIRNKNIAETLELYLNSDKHNIFINYCKKVFVKYLANYPFDFIPLISYIELEINDGE